MVLKTSLDLLQTLSFKTSLCCVCLWGLLHVTHAGSLPWCSCKYDFKMSHYHIVICYKTSLMWIRLLLGWNIWKMKYVSFELLFVFHTLIVLNSSLWYLDCKPGCKSRSPTLIAVPAFRIPVWCTKWGPTSPWWRACDSAAVLTPEKWGS